MFISYEIKIQILNKKVEFGRRWLGWFFLVIPSINYYVYMQIFKVWLFEFWFLPSLIVWIAKFFWSYFINGWLQQRCRDCSSRISIEAHIWSRPTWKGGGGREIMLKGLKLKNGRNERSFIFALQSKFKLKKIIHKNLGSLRGAFYMEGQSLRGAF